MSLFSSYSLVPAPSVSVFPLYLSALEAALVASKIPDLYFPTPTSSHRSTSQEKDSIPVYAFISEVPPEPPDISAPSLPNTELIDIGLKTTKKYKPVALKTKPVLGELAENSESSETSKATH